MFISMQWLTAEVEVEMNTEMVEKVRNNFGKSTINFGLSILDYLFSEPLPNYFKESHEWEIEIIDAPECPVGIKVLRLIKTSPFNFDLRQLLRSHMKNQGAQTKGVFFIIGLGDPYHPKKVQICEEEILKTMISGEGSLFWFDSFYLWFISCL